MRFDALTVHQPLALAFLSLALYTLTKPGVTWRLLTVLAAFATVASHEFTAIVGSVFFLFAALGILVLTRWFNMKRGSVESSMLKMPGLIVTMTFTWLAFVALPFFATSVGFADFVVATFLGVNAPLAFPLTVAKTVPTSWDRVVGDIGIVLFAGTCMLGFIWTLRKREAAQYKQFLPYAISGALLFFIGLTFYFKSHQATDLLSRGFIYVYFFAAPISLYAILKTSSHLRSKIRYQQVMSICLICIVVVAGVYYNYPRYFHDNKASLDIEDVRFPLFQWQSAGYFVKNYTGGNTLWGDKIAFDYVGGYGQKNILEPDPSLNVTLAQWASTYPSIGDVVILRKSMSTVPFANYARHFPRPT